VIDDSPENTASSDVDVLAVDDGPFVVDESAMTETLSATEDDESESEVMDDVDDNQSQNM